MSKLTIVMLAAALMGTMVLAQAPPEDSDAMREKERKLVAFKVLPRHVYVETQSRFKDEDLARRARHRFLASVGGRVGDTEIEVSRKLTFRFERQSEAVLLDNPERTDFGPPGEDRLTSTDMLARLAAEDFMTGRQRDPADVTGRHRRARIRTRVHNLACYATAAGETPVREDITAFWNLTDWSNWDCTRYDADGNEVTGADRDVRAERGECVSVESNDDGCDVTATLYFSRKPRTIGEGEDAIEINGRGMKWDLKAEGCSCPSDTDRLGFAIQVRGRAHRARRGEDDPSEDVEDVDEIVAETEEGEDEVDGEAPRFQFRRRVNRLATCSTGAERTVITRDNGVDEPNDADDERDGFARVERSRLFVFLLGEDSTCGGGVWDPSIGTTASIESNNDTGRPRWLVPVIIAASALVVVGVAAAMFARRR